MVKFVYNKDELRFDAQKFSVKRVLGIVLKYLVISALLAVAYYVIFALFFSTDKEKRLEAENKYLMEQSSEMADKVNRLDNVVQNLQIRDQEIYEDVFHSNPPNYFLLIEDTNRVDLKTIYSSDEEDLVWDAHVQGERVDNIVTHVDGRILNINKILDDPTFNPEVIPSIIPIRNFSVAQTGASVGQKINPFYKTVRFHSGMDLLAPIGTEIIAAASGKVTSVTRSSKGMGNRVEITHENGLVTTYSHLSDILVSNGQIVKQGNVIGRVGSSGTAFAPHLHYEVIRNGNPEDPINYFFADVSPLLYQEMMVIALNTGQSMD